MDQHIIYSDIRSVANKLLIDELPLKGPIILQYFPAYSCVLKCKYCMFSMPRAERGFISTKVRMDMKIFCKSLFDAEDFKDTIKVIRFVGMGEPLLHKEIHTMVRMAKNKFPNARTEIITNGLLLDKPMADNLAKSGLDRITVSLQGMSSWAYFKISVRGGKYCKVAKLIEDLKYFKSISKTHIYCKIVDIALGHHTKEAFYKKFGECCHSIGVEHASPIYPGVALNEKLGMTGETQFNEPTKKMQICPQSFFTMQINPDGNVVPCYSVAYPEIMGNINRKTLKDIWNGHMWKTFRKNMISRGRGCNKICSDCKICEFRYNKEDDLDEHKDRLKMLFDI